MRAALLAGIPGRRGADVEGGCEPRSRPSTSGSHMWSAVQNAWYGLSLGSVLLLAAIGLAITFGVMGVINMAHGEMVMLGAYTTFVGAGTDPHAQSGAVRLFAADRGSAGIPASRRWSASLIERGVIRFLYGRPLETLLATWGISLILQQAVRTIFGSNNREVGDPTWMSGAFELGGLTITYNRLWIIVFALAVFVALLGAAALHPARPARCAR